jgi:inosose dehydratase
MGLAVRIGVNPTGWTNDDLPSLGAETPLEVALSDGQRIGYQGFELGGRFPRRAAALRAALLPRGLACVSGWWPGRLAARSAEEEEREAEPHLDLLLEAGAALMIYGEVQDSIQSSPEVPLFKRPHLRDPAAWRAYGERLTTLARRLLSRGLRLAYHHHVGAYVESPEDVDRLMAATGPEVGLLLDTGHAALAGGDPADLLERHAERVSHVHCKDVRPAVVRMARNRAWSFLQSVLAGVFTVPGDGGVDFRRVLSELDRHGYRGWLVVEADQDPAVAPSAAYAEKGYRHLAGLLAELGSEPRETT